MRRVAQWAGFPLEARHEATLTRFQRWLGTEAVAAGGLGPNERTRLWQRHIADSLTYAAATDGRVPHTLLDVGSGVGLPGIPLAVLWPGCVVTLLDRSERRCRLARRAVRVLELENVTVRCEDVSRHQGGYHVVTFRAALPPPAAIEAAHRLLLPGGIAVVGLSHEGGAEVAISGAHRIDVPEGILDSAPALLTMTRQS